MVDRGPLTWDVVSFFKNTSNAFSVMGNHERRIAGTIRGTIPPAWSQEHSLLKIPKPQHESWASWFETLPAVIETPHAIITHARLDPEKEINQQDPHFTCAVGGAGVKIELNNQQTPVWFEQWKKNFGLKKPICMGHVGYSSVELISGELFALDTGACRQGELTAVILPENRIVRVAVEENYIKNAQREWTLKTYSEERPESFGINEMLRLLTKDDRTDLETIVLKKFQACLVQHDIRGRIPLLHKKLLGKLGEIPPPGPTRGDYFKGIKEQLMANINHRLVRLLLSDSPSDLEPLLDIFRKKNLGNILDDLKAIEQIA